jgi:tRNA threonylcarbamoyladenosine biosynthesis protein TsaB
MTSMLAIDTSTAACSVALQYRGRITSKSSAEPRSHSQLLMTMVHEVLQESACSLSQLDAIGVTVGPGSFTGLRIGFATVQGLAYATDIPVVPVSTLQVMVATFLRTGDTQHITAQHITEGTEVIALLDARMSEYSLGRYTLGNQAEIKPLAEDQLMTQQQVLAAISAANPQALIGEAQQLVADHPSLATLYQPIFPQAEDILPIAQTIFRQGGAVPVDSVDLVYLRGAEAWQKRKRLRPNREG